MKHKTLIIVNGGVVQDVITTDNNNEFYLLDYDEGNDISRLSTIPMNADIINRLEKV